MEDRAGSEPERPRRPRARVGDWWIDFETGEMRRARERSRLQPTDAALLERLAVSPGEVVSKAELLATVWRGSHVADEAVWQAVSRVRRALGDDPARPRYVETLPRRGYRLVASVSEETSRPAADAEIPTSRDHEIRHAPLRWSIVAVLAALAAFALWPRSPDLRTASAPVSVATDAATLHQIARDRFERAGFLDNEAAITLSRRAIEMEPRQAGSHALLARALAAKVNLWQGGIELAELSLDHARTAARIAPDAEQSRLALAEAYWVNGRSERGLEVLEHTPSSSKAIAESAHQRALLLLSTGRLAEGARLKRRHPLGGADAVIDLHHLAVVYARVGATEAALRQARAALHVAPFNELTLMLAAELLTDRADWDRARARVDLLVDSHPRSPHAWNTAGYLARAMGDLSGAIEAFRRSAEITQGRRANGIGFLRLVEALSAADTSAGEAEAILGGVEAACRELIENGSEASGPRVLLAMVASLRGNETSAAEWLHEAMDVGAVNARLLDEHVFDRVRGTPPFEAASIRMHAVAARERAALASHGFPVTEAR